MKNIIILHLISLMWKLNIIYIKNICTLGLSGGGRFTLGITQSGSICNMQTELKKKFHFFLAIPISSVWKWLLWESCDRDGSTYSGDNTRLHKRCNVFLIHIRLSIKGDILRVTPMVKTWIEIIIINISIRL